MTLPVEETEVLVVGGGCAGLTVASRLALRGHGVTVVSCATPATALSTGQILLDVNDRSAEEWASFFMAQFRRQGAYYELSRTPIIGFTNLGTTAPRSISSPLFDWTAQDKNVAVVGIVGNDDFYPDLVCHELYRTHRAKAKPYWLTPSASPELDSEGFIEEVGDALMDLPESIAVLPPLPSRTPYGLLAELRKRTGRRVVEPATPLSWPGRRFQRLMENTAAMMGVRILKDRRMVALRIEKGRAVEATLSSGARAQEVRFNTLVLATGGLISGGLAVKGTEVVDPLGLFQVETAPGNGIASPSLRSALSAGLSTHHGRPITRQGEELTNVVVAGSIHCGLSHPLGQGLGAVLVHAWKAAQRAEEVL